MGVYVLSSLENIRRNLKSLSQIIHRDMPNNDEAIDLINHLNSLIDDAIIEQERAV